MKAFFFAFIYFIVRPFLSTQQKDKVLVAAQVDGGETRRRFGSTERVEPPPPVAAVHVLNMRVA